MLKAVRAGGADAQCLSPIAVSPMCPKRVRRHALCDDAGVFSETGVLAVDEALRKKGFTKGSGDLPDDERNATIAKIHVAWKELHLEAAVDDLPEVLRTGEFRRAARGHVQES